MEFNPDKKANFSVIITGSSSGNGRAIAKRLARSGAQIICSDLDPAARADGYEDDLSIPTHEAILNAGGRAVFQRCDVSNLSDFQKLFMEAEHAFGSVDALVNNAGVFTGLATIFDEDPINFDRAISVNLKGVWNGCKTAALFFRDRGKPGKIINIASVGGLVGIGSEPGYCATKGAVINMTRAIALDCAPYHIAVNAIAPGFIVTGMVREFMDQPAVLETMREATPWPRFGAPSDVAGACAYLCSDDAEWVTGSVLTVDGGFTAK